METYGDLGDGIEVIDLACGVGGDLHKLIGRNVREYIGVDISKISLEEADHRFDQMMQSQKERVPNFGVEFLWADLTQPLEYAIPAGSIQIAIMNFALHYFFESAESLNTLLHTVSFLLGPGGIFAGTMSDAGVILRRLIHKSSHKPRGFFNDRSTNHTIVSNKLHAVRFGWEFYELVKQSTMIPKFGVGYEFILGTAREKIDPPRRERQPSRQYSSHKSKPAEVVQGWCMEYLAPWTVLEEEAAKHGLKLLHFQNSHEFFHDSLKSEHQRKQMQLFGVSGVEQPSADEWATVHLTTTFMFQKIQDPNFEGSQKVSPCNIINNDAE